MPAGRSASELSLKPEERSLLLELARNAIAARLGLEAHKKLGQLPPALCERKACFVSLHCSGELRGCIGTLEAREELWRAVRGCAVAAAFGDPRFPPLGEHELGQLKIEISVLSRLRELSARSSEEIIASLRPGVDGVVLRVGPRSATFLPQVWSQFPDKESFLARLALKAGLTEDGWRSPDARIAVYQVEHFSE